MGTCSRAGALGTFLKGLFLRLAFAFSERPGLPHRARVLEQAQTCGIPAGIQGQQRPRGGRCPHTHPTPCPLVPWLQAHKLVRRVAPEAVSSGGWSLAQIESPQLAPAFGEKHFRGEREQKWKQKQIQNPRSIPLNPMPGGHQGVLSSLQVRFGGALQVCQKRRPLQ